MTNITDTSSCDLGNYVEVAARKYTEVVDIQENIPRCIYWNIEQVASWIRNLGFPQYVGCFKKNFISGRKLIAVDASSLPSIGVRDFQDIKKIALEIRRLLKLPDKIPNMPMGNPRIAYLEIKRRTGVKTDAMHYKAFLHDNKHWFPHAIYHDC